MKTQPVAYRTTISRELREAIRDAKRQKHTFADLGALAGTNGTVIREWYVNTTFPLVDDHRVLALAGALGVKRAFGTLRFVDNYRNYQRVVPETRKAGGKSTTRCQENECPYIQADNRCPYYSSPTRQWQTKKGCFFVRPLPSTEEK